MNSKFMGKVFEGFEVVDAYLKDKYRKSYNGNPIKNHNAYKFTLVNYDTRKSITISGNQLRKIAKGTRTISDMLSSTVLGGSNSRINAYKRGNL